MPLRDSDSASAAFFFDQSARGRVSFSAMSENRKPLSPRPEPAAGESPAFLQAVADLGSKRAITTSKAIYNAQGIKLLEGGARVDQELYDRLVSHRLMLPLDECVDAEPSVNGAILRDAVAAAVARWPFFARVAPPGAAGVALIDAVAAVTLPKPVSLHLTLARETRPALFEHSVLMALLAAWLVRESGGSRADIADAAAAGLLHDMGMLHIDPGLLDSDDRLSGQQLRPLYVHPLTSSMLIGRFKEYPKEIARGIVEHHERLDGSGYPRGLAAAAISPLGRVLALAEVVTAMFDGERKHPEQRVSLLLRINPRRYDAKAVVAIHQLLGVAPVLAEGDDVAAAPLIARLLQLVAVLAQWHSLSEALVRVLDGAHSALLQSLDEQNATLQRMLYDAGVTTEQLGALAGEVGDDIAFRLELWALAEELLWQLHASASQLERRWQSTEPALPHPPALASWLAAVAALDAEAPTSD